ncbi:uncharacterized protein LOC131207806 [Anopheles bellator]|uniref:uncharacterized protein LOC131207806 n=1 Tax=Anopheles bellator TaxID=139047 RepID=UPI002647B531|nr:uncharacterized protein LOC131207806 [Anopheles bellator]
MFVLLIVVVGDKSQVKRVSSSSEMMRMIHGETKTIVFNSYGATVPSAPGATLPKDETDAATRQETRSESTGRAFSSSDSVNGFPFSIHPNYLSKPVQVARPVDDAYQTPKYIYPSYSDSSRNSRPYYDGPVAMDRFAPGEAYGGTIYKLKKQKLALQQGGGGGPFASIPAASFNSPVSVVAPTVLRPAASDNSPVNIPAPPGLSSSGSPPSPAMPSMDGPPMPSMDGPPSPTIIAPTPNPSSGDDTAGTIPVGPGKPQYLPPYYADSRPPPPPPVPMKMPTMPMMPMMPPMMQAPANMPPMDGPPTGPTGMDHDHDHHHHHHDHDFPYLTGFDHDHYPDIIYDHDHFHHHHDEPTTTPAPPPPPPPPPVPETPRLKNYSYYYISRTLWYVPLYFTLYFCFYVTALILRSIARHKVNIPNEWTANQRSLSSLADLSDAQTRQKATMLATFTMKQIEDFREKYL